MNATLVAMTLTLNAPRGALPMPGGRLTYADRQQIAAGLAEHLGYAEIARRLGRPTSTVSREVSRNLDQDGSYRPDRAHRATAQRARRDNKPGRLTATPVIDDPHGPDPVAVQELAGRLTELMIETGLPRMVARVLSCIYVTDNGALTAAELVQRLQVSPASISSAVAYLANLGLLRREKSPARRRELYIVDDDVWLRSLLTTAQANGSWSVAARRGADLFGPTSPTGRRFDEMGRFFDYLTDTMVTAIERWHQMAEKS